MPIFQDGVGTLCDPVAEGDQRSVIPRHEQRFVEMAGDYRRHAFGEVPAGAIEHPLARCPPRRGGGRGGFRPARAPRCSRLLFLSPAAFTMTCLPCASARESMRVAGTSITPFHEASAMPASCAGKSPMLGEETRR